MATSKLQRVKLSSIKVDYKRNPRLSTAYEEKDKDFKDLVASLDTEGFRSDKPIVLSQRENGELWLVQGHRRFAAATLVNKRDPSKLTELDAIVFKGLTSSAEERMMIDHFLVKQLGEFEQYLAVKRLFFAGLGEAEIGKHIGKSRGFAQRRCWIAQLPPEVEGNWLKKFSSDEGIKSEYVNLRDEDLQELYKAHVADRDSGQDAVNGGPKYTETWGKLVETGRSKPSEPKSRTRKEILNLASAYRDPLVARIMKFCAGDSIEMSEVLDEMATLRTKASAWDGASVAPMIPTEAGV